MKKIFTLIAAAFVAVSVNAQTIYSWSSTGEGAENVTEVGGKLEQKNGASNRLNYANADYFTICLNGKYKNFTDEDGSDNACYMQLTLDGNTFKTDDKIAVTGYYNKGEKKSVTIYFHFANGTEIEDNGPWYDIKGADGEGLAPSTNTYSVPAEADGQTVLQMTRKSTGTNLFITKLEVYRGTPSGINEVKIAAENNVVYNLAGQKVSDSYKGVVIINGKKVIK